MCVDLLNLLSCFISIHYFLTSAERCQHDEGIQLSSFLALIRELPLACCVVFCGAVTFSFN